ncbi:unnamed protein product, partial [Calypogeia fissa]
YSQDQGVKKPHIDLFLSSCMETERPLKMLSDCLASY